MAVSCAATWGLDTNRIYIVDAAGGEAFLADHGLPPRSQWAVDYTLDGNQWRVARHLYTDARGRLYTLSCSGSVWELYVEKTKR